MVRLLLVKKNSEFPMINCKNIKFIFLNKNSKKIIFDEKILVKKMTFRLI